MRPSSRIVSPILLAGTLFSCQSDSVTPGNVAPVATITTPTASAVFSGGETISYAGTATDPE
ncbi:MAG: hypothetical protein E4H41_10825, partial [Gemmatimonadales bacterium]